MGNTTDGRHDRAPTLVDDAEPQLPALHPPKPLFAHLQANRLASDATQINILPPPHLRPPSVRALHGWRSVLLASSGKLLGGLLALAAAQL
jgi:hypothetical protein